MPRTKDGVPEVRVGDKLDIAGTLKNGQQLLFYAKVTKNDISYELEKPSILHLKWPDNFARKQLRENVRIEFVMKAYYSDEIDSEMQLVPEKTHTGVVVDISGGGVFLWTKEKAYLKNTDLHLFLYIDSGKQKLRTIIPCKVVVMKPIGKAKGGTMVQGMALNFTNLSQRSRNFLDKWIAEQQRIQAAERAERKRK
jgi:c-di-GMP-binding flagellar brake protein YcgR